MIEVVGFTGLRWWIFSGSDPRRQPLLVRGVRHPRRGASRLRKSQMAVMNRDL